MASPWFTETGASGELRLVQEGEDWFVASHSDEHQTKCIFDTDKIRSEEATEVEIRATVSEYLFGEGDKPDYLFLADIIEENTLAHSSPVDSSPTDKNSQAVSDTEAATTDPGNDDLLTLSEFTGSGNYVSVEATVDTIHWVKKEEPGVPDIRGELIDDSVNEGVVFIIQEDVRHPYLEEGRWFLFDGVKDHYYSKRAEVQVVITEHTEFDDRGGGTGSGKPGPSNSSTQATQPPSSGTSESAQAETSNKSLDKIAQDQLSGQEFTLEQSEDSLVGSAKKQAKNQQRAPAIDPRLLNPAHDDSDSDHDD